MQDLTLSFLTALLSLLRDPLLSLLSFSPFSWEGVEAVVDKDYASTVLAGALGVDRILDLTGVEYAKLNFGLPEEQNLETLTVMEVRKYLDDGHFAPGSVGPKIEAAVQFLENGGREVIMPVPRRRWKGSMGAQALTSILLAGGRPHQAASGRR